MNTVLTLLVLAALALMYLHIFSQYVYKLHGHNDY